MIQSKNMKQQSISCFNWKVQSFSQFSLAHHCLLYGVKLYKVTISLNTTNEKRYITQ